MGPSTTGVIKGEGVWTPSWTHEPVSPRLYRELHLPPAKATSPRPRYRETRAELAGESPSSPPSYPPGFGLCPHVSFHQIFHNLANNKTLPASPVFLHLTAAREKLDLFIWAYFSQIQDAFGETKCACLGSFYVAIRCPSITCVSPGNFPSA